MNSIARTLRDLGRRLASWFRLRRTLGWALTTLAVTALTVDTSVTAAAGVKRVATASLMSSTTTISAPASVGALFKSGSSTHSCSASVLDTPDGDLILTAAHCITGNAAGMRFAPGYTNGTAPYGTWTVTAAYAPQGWLSSGSSTDDVAVLRVAPQVKNGVTRTVQSVVGGISVGSTATSGTNVTVVGYAAGSGDSALACRTSTSTRSSGGVGYPTFTCGAFPTGTSGGPWLTTVAGKTTVVGIIGGLYQGGCSAQTSYSTPLKGVNSLISTARTTSGQTLPSAPASGC